MKELLVYLDAKIIAVELVVVTVIVILVLWRRQKKART